MYELVKAGHSTYFLDCPSKIGFIEFIDNGVKKVIVVDSGNDKFSAKKIIKTAEEKGWEIDCVFNTHSHADHIGGNAYLIEKLNVKTYLPYAETPYTYNTYLEPALLYGGFPPDILKTKFFVAPPSLSHPLNEMKLPDKVNMVSLPGHFISMSGIKSADDIWFLGDALIGEEVLKKHPITYLYDIKAQLQLFDKLKELNGSLFIFSHAEPVKNLNNLISINKSKMEQIIDSILKILKSPCDIYTLESKLFQIFEIKSDFSQYYLVGSTIRSYLAYLLNENIINYSFENNMLYYYTNEKE